MTNNELLELLKPLVHPDSGEDIVSLGMVTEINISEDRVIFTLQLHRANDPFANKLKRFATALIEESYPQYEDCVTIVVKEPLPPKSKPVEELYATSNNKSLGKVIAISSGKGGVGKSTTTANLAVSLAELGFNVGVLDADVYGPSIPKMFDLEDYEPIGQTVGESEMIIPAENYGVKIMSLGFFINPTDAIIWRGAMATNAIKQLVHQTLWGDLDYLLIDLPPGTGDIHLAIFSELRIDGAIIVSTPQKVAQLDVVRGIEMFRSDKIDVPIVGIIENMAWFTPEELPDNKYYIFGQEGCAELADSYDVPLLGQIPLVEGISSAADNGRPRVLDSSILRRQFSEVIVNILAK